MQSGNRLFLKVIALNLAEDVEQVRGARFESK